jgi:hypothetical protein
MRVHLLFNRLRRDAQRVFDASGVLEPCAMMQMPLTPRSGLPPYSS